MQTGYYACRQDVARDGPIRMKTSWYNKDGGLLVVQDATCNGTEEGDFVSKGWEGHGG